MSHVISAIENFLDPLSVCRKDVSGGNATMSSTPFHTHRTVIIIIITLLSADNNSHLAAVDNEAISAMTIQGE